MEDKFLPTFTYKDKIDEHNQCIWSLTDGYEFDDTY